MENKKYYWLKLKEDFFDDDTISFIEEQENGKEYCLFYLKLCLKSLKTNGTLMRLIGENYIPYDAKALSKLTNTNIDTVTNAMNLFQKIGLISVFETGEIYINQINEMIGKETQMALYMRQKRAKEKLPEVEEVNNVNLMLTECKTEIDIDKRDRNKDLSKKQKHKNGIYQNVLLTDDELKKLCDELGPEKTKKVIDNYSELKEMKGYKYKSDYLAIKKWGIRAYEEQKEKNKKFENIEKRDYIINPCPQCNQLKLYYSDDENFIICECCGTETKTNEMLEYWQKKYKEQ